MAWQVIQIIDTSQIVSFVNLQSVIDNGNGLFWGVYSAGIYDRREKDILFAVKK